LKLQRREFDYSRPARQAKAAFRAAKRLSPADHASNIYYEPDRRAERVENSIPRKSANYLDKSVWYISSAPIAIFRKKLESGLNASRATYAPIAADQRLRSPQDHLFRADVTRKPSLQDSQSPNDLST
jgi:hypothetical protein